MSGLAQAFRNLKAAVDFECERGGEGGFDRLIEVKLDDLSEVISWLDDVKDNDHVDVYGFMKG